MKVAITGGTGFVGRHVAEQLVPDETVIISRRLGSDISDLASLMKAFEGVEVVVHSAGINRELKDQTYEKVHVQGTKNVIEAAKAMGVKKVILLSYLRVRPGSGSPYHESKWQAEELVRKSGLEYTILRPGIIYGHGDHLLDHLSHSLYTIPVFATVGFHEKTIKPIPVSELVAIIKAAINGELTNQTVPVVGAEEVLMSEAVHRVARIINKNVIILPFPIWFHKGLAQVTEWTMTVPLIAKSQVRMLSEGVSQPTPTLDQLPDELKPKLMFDREQIRKGLPSKGGFGLHDLLFVKDRKPAKTPEKTSTSYQLEQGYLNEK